MAAGYIVVHLSPQRTWLSDSLSAGDDITWFSWVAVIGLIVASLALALAGWSVFRRRDGLVPTVRRGPVLHPVTTVLAAGNLVILAGSLATI